MSRKEKAPKAEKVTTSKKKKLGSENLKDVSGGRLNPTRIPWLPRGR